MQPLNQSRLYSNVAGSFRLDLGSGVALGALGWVGLSAGHERNAAKAKRRTRAGSEIRLGNPPAAAHSHSLK